jgi:chemotaxis protein methyltransferase CheR
LIRIDPVERSLFIDGIFRKYGFDFSPYAEASFNRRLTFVMDRFKMPGLLELLAWALRSQAAFFEMLPHMTITTTELFRDPQFFKSLREKVIPVLKTYSRINIWTAGCSIGQELISLAIVLEEEGIASRCNVYATDINPMALKMAQNAIYPIADAQTFTKNYSAAGGLKAPSDYYTAEYDLIRFHPRLLSNVIFSEHNLLTDDVFQEFHLVICRNVLIYFTPEGQERALQLFIRSLKDRGFLVIGNRESLRTSDVRKVLDTLNKHENIFQVKHISSEPKHQRVSGELL